MVEVATIAAEVGDRIELTEVLLVSDGGEITIGSPNVEKALVVLEVLDHGRGKKVINFKYKAKVRYRRKRGHRQGFTRVRVAEMRLGDKVVRATERSARAEAEDTTVGEQMQGPITGAAAAEDAVEAQTASETAAPRAVPAGRRNRTVRTAPEAAVDTPVGEGMEEITGAEAAEEAIAEQAEAETVDTDSKEK